MPAAYLLDTDHCIAYLNRNRPSHAQVAGRINATPASELYVSLFTALELAEGPFHALSVQDRQVAQAAIATFLNGVSVINITEPVVQEFGRIRAELRQQGQVIGDMDIGIAATAIVHDLTLVTHNTSHFSRISGLSLDDWC